jgi:hypothetical protein
MRKPKIEKHETPRIQFACNGIVTNSVVFRHRSESSMAVKLALDDPHSLHVMMDRKRSVVCMKNIGGFVYLFHLNWSPITGTCGMFSLLSPDRQTHVRVVKMWRENWHPFRLPSEDANVFKTSHNGNTFSIKLSFCVL